MAPRRAKKTTRRVALVDNVVTALTNPEIRGTIDLHRPEDFIKQFMYTYLISELTAVHRSLSPTLSEAKLRRKAQRSVVWEGDVKRAIRHLSFFGVPHRPDFEVMLPWIRLAVEVKRGAQGKAIRESIGQCLVYAQKYDFVVCVFLDTSDTLRIKGSANSTLESAFVNSLWSNYNIRFAVT